MSFSCPHYDYATEFCTKVKVTCVPGRPGCVLTGKVTFAGDINERIKKTEELNQSQKGKLSTCPNDQDSP